jgi:hypothetical protein
MEQANPKGKLYVVADNLASHTSAETNTWRADHPRLQPVFIPVGACWLNRARRAGGASSAAMHWLGRVLPILMRSRKPPARPLCSSTGEPSHGSGAGLPRRAVTFVTFFFLIAFKELSSREEF